MALRRKSFLAAFSTAVVRLFTRVESQMRFEVTFLVESFRAVFKRADEVFCPIVALQMHV